MCEIRIIGIISSQTEVPGIEQECWNIYALPLCFPGSWWEGLALVFQGKVMFALQVCAEVVPRKSSFPWRVWTHLIWIRLS